MRLGFHYHVPAAWDGAQIWMPGYQGRFVDSLATFCSEVVCFLHSPPTTSERAQMDYALQRPNVRLVDLGPQISAPRRLLKARTYAGILQSQRTLIDALLLRGPSPLLPALAGAVHPLPVALLLVGDAVAGVADLRQPPWRKMLIRFLWQWNRWGQDRVARKTLTFVNSRKLFTELELFVPNLSETRTTTLTQQDFFHREDTCAHPPYRLLYTGRMDRGKGLLELVQAVGILVESGEDVRLDLVGWPEPGDNVLEELTAFGRRLGVSDRISYHGRKPVGPELFAHYREADIYVVASKSSEGFPRTIWEAMAHGLPVVATTVGSIPKIVDEAAALVPPNDIRALVEAIRGLIHSAEKRKEMIRTGRILASEMTLEKQVVRMVREMEEWIERRT